MPCPTPMANAGENTPARARFTKLRNAMICNTVSATDIVALATNSGAIPLKGMAAKPIMISGATQRKSAGAFTRGEKKMNQNAKHTPHTDPSIVAASKP